MSSDELKDIIEVGNDLTAMDYYAIARTTLFFYDFLLTLADEIKYVWKGRKSWMFAIFLANRYLPMPYQIWLLYVTISPAPSQQLCDKTAFIDILAFVGSTTLAQMVLTPRVHAVTRRNWTITSFFCVITVSQFILGLYTTVYAATEGAQQIIDVPLRAYKLCFFIRHRPLEIGFTTMSLVYDLLAFLVIVYLVLRSKAHQVPIPNLLRTIAKDATYYFLLIFTSHLLFELTLLFARPTLQLLPATGSVVFLPVMITRLMLSLKKAARPEEDGWSLGEPTAHGRMVFAQRQEGVPMRDEIPLNTFESTLRGSQSRA